MRILTITLFLVALPALAQTSDTTSAWRYFPLQVSNVWEYQEDGSVGSPSGDHRITIEADTVIQGQQYVVLAHDGIDCSPCISRYIIRFDLEAGTLVQRTSGGEEVSWFYSPCPLGADFGAETACGEVGGGYEETVELVDGTILEGVAYKSFNSGFRARGYVAGVGFITDEILQYEPGETRLRYARIDGVEYGEPFPVATEGAPESADVALSVFPNPSREAVTARLSLDRPQRVTLAVYDVLGRRVLSRDLGAQSAGAVDHRLDVASLPGGVYVVRLDGDGGARAMTRLVRH